MKTDCIDHGHTTSLSPAGYKQLRYQTNGGHRSLHRKVYAQHRDLSAIDIEGQVVRHTCDNTRCVNPEHLLIGTLADNNRDRAERGRSTKVHPALRRLTDSDAAEIRRICVPSPKGGRSSNPSSYAALARRFGVGHATIRQAYLGSTYHQAL